MKYVYTAIFAKEEPGYSINFPAVLQKTLEAELEIA